MLEVRVVVPPRRGVRTVPSKDRARDEAELDIIHHYDGRLARRNHHGQPVPKL